MDNLGLFQEEYELNGYRYITTLKLSAAAAYIEEHSNKTIVKMAL